MVQKHVNKLPKHTHELWQKEFGMEPVIFQYPQNLIAQNKKSDTKFRKSIAIEKRMAVALSRLSSLIEQFLKYLELGNQSFQLFSRIAARSFGQLFL